MRQLSRQLEHARKNQRRQVRQAPLVLASHFWGKVKNASIQEVSPLFRNDSDRIGRFVNDAYTMAQTYVSSVPQLHGGKPLQALIDEVALTVEFIYCSVAPVPLGRSA